MKRIIGLGKTVGRFWFIASELPHSILEVFDCKNRNSVIGRNYRRYSRGPASTTLTRAGARAFHGKILGITTNIPTSTGKNIFRRRIGAGGAN